MWIRLLRMVVIGRVSMPILQNKQQNLGNDRFTLLFFQWMSKKPINLYFAGVSLCCSLDLLFKSVLVDVRVLVA